VLAVAALTACGPASNGLHAAPAVQDAPSAAGDEREFFGDPERYSSRLKTELEAAAGAPEDLESRDVALRALRQSPVLVFRTFTDGHEPSGWDLAYRTALRAASADGDTVAAGLLDVMRELGPERWKVAEGLVALRKLVSEHARHDLVAQMTFRVADRLAPFDAYRDAAKEIVRLTADQDVPPACRHLYALAELRLEEKAARVPRRSDLWAAAAASAPDDLSREVTRIAGLRDRVRHAGEGARASALAEFAAWASGDDVSPFAARVAREQLVRLHAERIEVGAAVAQADALWAIGADASDVAGCLAIIARDLVRHAHGITGVDRERLDAALVSVREKLGESLVTAEMDFALAGVAQVADDTDVALTHLENATRIAFSGASVEPPDVAASEWWAPLARRARAELRPVETSRSATWVLANRLFEAGRYERAVAMFEVVPPGEGCGNVFDEALTLRSVRRALSLERLGRTDDARGELRDFLRGSVSWRSTSTAVVELVEFEQRQRALDDLGRWLGTVDLTTDVLRKARAFSTYAKAKDRGDAAAAREATRKILSTWPNDDVLRGRLGDPDHGDRGGTPPR